MGEGASVGAACRATPRCAPPVWAGLAAASGSLPAGPYLHEEETPGAVLVAWLHRFFTFITSKRHVGSELLKHSDDSNPFFSENRDRVLAAGRPLLTAAQRSHEVSADLTLEQSLDMIIAIGTIHGRSGYLEPILQTALDGLRRPTDVEPA
jgi:hypothetical protein